MTTGSYFFDDFSESHKELDRLQQQARQIEPFERSVLQSAGLGEGMKALDIGCGPGIISCLMAKIVGSKGEVTGIDASDDLLGVANEISKASGATNLTFQKADIYALDLPENAYDFAYSRLVFQHLNDPAAALQKLIRVLKPGGVLCIADIDDDWLSVEPQPAAFKSLVERSTQRQAQQGGDRFIGHKLGTYMEHAGLSSVDVHVMPLNSHMLGMRNFLDIGISFRVFATANDQEHKQAKAELQQLESLTETPGAWGFLAIFVATGKKPTNP